MEVRLRQGLARAEQVSRELSDPAIASDPPRLKSLGREHARLQPIVRVAERLVRARQSLAEARELAGLFRENFTRFADDAGTAVTAAGPQG